MLGILTFFIVHAEQPSGDFICDGVTPPTLDVTVEGIIYVCPGESETAEPTVTPNPGTMYGHYEGTGEKESFSIDFTQTTVTPQSVPYTAPKKNILLAGKQTYRFNVVGVYEGCDGEIKNVKKSVSGSFAIKNCDNEPQGTGGPDNPPPVPGPVPGPDNGGGNGGGGGGGGGDNDEECSEPAQPDQGVAEFMGGDSAWIVWPAPNEAWSEEQKNESTWFVATHRIVTINTPKKRDLTGKIQLNKISGDESCVKLLSVKDDVESPYNLGLPLPIVEPGHFGCGVHENHQGEQYFGFIPVKAGQVVLEAVVDPDQGSPTKKAKITINIVEMDLDIEHPATGEVAEEKEETDGLVAVKRDNDTPLTRLKLKPIKPSGIGGKYYLTFPGNLKIWQNENRSGAVTETTEFNPAVETTVFVEAMKKSDKLNDQQIVLNWKEGDEKAISYGDWVNLTAVEAEVEATIKYWIREQWLNLPEWHPYNIGGLKIARGDDREASLILKDSFRLGQTIILNPFKELDEDGIKDNSEIKFKGISRLFVKATSVPHPDEGYSNDNRLFNDVQPWKEKEVIVDDVYADGKRINNRIASVRFHGDANDEAVWLSADIDWDFEFKVDASDPLKIKYTLEGWHDDYPAIEIHVEDSQGPRFHGYVWLHPLPSNVFDLINGKKIDITDKTEVNIP